MDAPNSLGFSFGIGGTGSGPHSFLFFSFEIEILRRSVSYPRPCIRWFDHSHTRFTSMPPSLSLSHTHTLIHTYTHVYPFKRTFSYFAISLIRGHSRKESKFSLTHTYLALTHCLTQSPTPSLSPSLSFRGGF